MMAFSAFTVLEGVPPRDLRLHDGVQALDAAPGRLIARLTPPRSSPPGRCSGCRGRRSRTLSTWAGDSGRMPVVHSSRPEATTVHGVKDSRFRLTSMEVEWGGRIAEGEQAHEREAILRVLAAMGGQLDRKTAASMTGQENPGDPDGTFKRAWKSLKDDGLAEASCNGQKLTAAGQKAADGLGVEV